MFVKSFTILLLGCFMDYDFSGYATKNDLRCADGRVIRHGAFKDNDGQTVPLVWQHVHTDPTNVLGHALLEDRDDGVYAYAKFNGTPSGKHAKEMVENGDIVSMSIYANRLKQHGSDVVHGVIREVSLVLAGANPGALIDNISFAHSDGTYTDSEEEAVIYTGLDSIEYFSHADEEEDDMANGQNGDILDELTDKQINAINSIIDAAINDTMDDLEENDALEDLTPDQVDEVQQLIEDAISDALEHADDDDDADDFDDEEFDDEEFDDDLEDDDDIHHADDDTVEDVFNTLNEDQKNVVYYLLSQVAEDASNNGNSAKHSFDGGYDMKHNVFDDDYIDENNDVLTHDEFAAIMEDASNANSLHDVFIAHGIENLDILFPEARMVRPEPDMITRQMGWVDKLWNGIKRTPFSRIKSVYADLTPDSARAKGYVKANQKVDQVLALLGRETSPQTIYKKQTIDRDDVVDIVDIDVIAWIKQEMRMMLNEEICRAILVGDGRGITDRDKIKPDKIRPIYGDDDVYTIYHEVTYGANDTDDQKASKVIDAAVRARKLYKGTGSPVMYASSDVISDLLLAKDGIGRRLYKDMNELATAMRVNEIIEVPILENVTRNRVADEDAGITAATMNLLAIIVNPKDYTIGADKGGAVSLFDDFDIDYNQMKYLIETRCSGALTLPYSAIALEVDASTVNP
jgi:HK97 family phage prohead protease